MSELPIWVQWVGELGIPLVALGAAIVGWVSYLQRRNADRKAEWWRRTQYALDLMMNAEDVVHVNTGMALVGILLDDKTATSQDLEMLAAVTDTAVNMMTETRPGKRRADSPGVPE